jgi:hypothetical protein
VGLTNLGSESETCVGSRVRRVGVSISFEKNFIGSHSLPPPSLVRRIGPSALSESDGKSWFKEASNEIELAISSFARNFNKRLDPMSLDRFIYLPLSLATSGL